MSSPPVRRLDRLMALAATAPLLAACAVTGSAGDEEGDGEGEASCAAVIVLRGHDYWGYGDLKRDPVPTGRTLRAVLPRCDDTGGQQRAEPDEAVEVAELADVPPETAVLWNGSVYIRNGRELPEATRRWFRSPRCAATAPFDLVADWIGVTGPHRLRFDGDLRPPYRLEVHVTRGPRAYVGTTITVRADSATEPGLGSEDVKTSLWRGGAIVSRVTCDTGRFRALSLISRPPA